MFNSTFINVFHKISTATVFIIVVVLIFFSSCSDSEIVVVDKNISREELPRLTATNITTIISDSGITRYRITTPKWKIYDKKEEPFWLFPKGLNFERFNEYYKVDAEMKSDSAIYLDKISLWEFNSNVKAKNLEGEYFETDQLFWDEKNERIYSDKKIKITQKTKIISGIGFESNSNLTRYTIRNPQGIIPLDETP